MSYVTSPILYPPISLSHAARVSIERWFEMPHAAAGPLVTPTKPILSTGLSARAAVAGTVASASAAAMVVKRFLRFITPPR